MGAAVEWPAAPADTNGVYMEESDSTGLDRQWCVELCSEARRIVLQKFGANNSRRFQEKLVPYPRPVDDNGGRTFCNCRSVTRSLYA